MRLDLHRFLGRLDDDPKQGVSGCVRIELRAMKLSRVAMAVIVGTLLPGCASSQHRTSPVSSSNSTNTRGTAASREPAANSRFPSGAVLVWGSNDSGQLGTGGPKSHGIPPTVLSLPGGPVKHIVCGDNVGIAITAGGTAFGWGDNADGQLNPQAAGQNQPLPTPLPYSGKVKAAAAGHSHTVLLLDNGQVVTLGWDRWGELGDGQIGENQGGSQPGGGPGPVIVRIPSPSSVVAVAATQNASFALAADGTVYAWGQGSPGQLGDGGTTDRPTPTKVGLPSGVVIKTLVAGAETVFAQAQDGSVWAWGDNSTGQTGGGDTVNVVPIPRQLHLPSGGHFVSLTAGGPDVAVLENGSVLQWGDFVGADVPGSTTPRHVPLPANAQIRLVAATGESVLLITESNKVLGYGYGDSDGVRANGIQATGYTPTPQPLPALSGAPIAELCLGGSHGMALVSR